MTGFFDQSSKTLLMSSITYCHQQSNIATAFILDLITTVYHRV